MCGVRHSTTECGVRYSFGRDVSPLWRLVFKLRGVWSTVGSLDFIVLDVMLTVVLGFLGWCSIGSPNTTPKANKNKSNIK